MYRALKKRIYTIKMVSIIMMPKRGIGPVAGLIIFMLIIASLTVAVYTLSPKLVSMLTRHTPNTIFNIYTSQEDVIIEHKGGDSIPYSDLRVKLANKAINLSNSDYVVILDTSGNSSTFDVMDKIIIKCCKILGSVNKTVKLEIIYVPSSVILVTSTVNTLCVVKLSQGESPETAEVIINGGFEKGIIGWNISATHKRATVKVVNSSVEGETINILGVKVNNTPHSGNSYLVMGYREYREDGHAGEHEIVKINITLTIPKDAKTLSFWFRLQGWDSKIKNADAYDYFKILINGKDIDYINQLTLDNYTGLVVDKYGIGRDNTFLPWGHYWDSGWRKATINISKYAGKTIDFAIVMRFFSDNIARTWLCLDDFSIE